MTGPAVDPLAGYSPDWRKKLRSFDDVSGGSSVALTATDDPLAGYDPSWRSKLQSGNIDLHSRPVVKNPDNTISTVRSMSFEEDGKEILIPTVSDDGRILSDDEAVAAYHKTGKHLGVFSDAAAADRYAQTLHDQQAAEYADPAKRATAAAVFEGASDVPHDPSTVPTMADRFGLTDPVGVAKQFAASLPEQVTMGARDLAGTVAALGEVGGNPIGLVGPGAPQRALEAGQAMRERFHPALDKINELAGGHPTTALGTVARMVGPAPLIGGVKALAGGLERKAGAAAGEAEAALARTVDAPVVSPAELEAAAPGTTGTAETIRSAAVRTSDGSWVEGPTHGVARVNAEEAGLSVNDATQDGFVTSHGRYVDTGEARRLAEAAKQATAAEPNSRGIRRKFLDSADLSLPGQADEYVAQRSVAPPRPVEADPLASYAPDWREKLAEPPVPRETALSPRSGAAAPTVMGGIAGAGVGGVAGSKVDEEHPLRGAIVGALAVGALGAAGMSMLGRERPAGPVGEALANRRGAVTIRPEPSSDTAIKSAIERAIEDSRGPRTPGAPVDPDEFVNVAKFALDDTGEARLRSEVTRVVEQYGLAPKAIVSHDQTRALASQIGLKDLPRDQINTRLNGPQMLAIRNIVSRNVEGLEQLYGKVKAGNLTPQELAHTDRSIGYLERENDALLSRFVRARSQTGRDLNNLKILANRVMDPFVWLTKAENMMQAQGEKLLPEQAARITELVKGGDRGGLVQYVAGLRKSSATDQAVSLWKTGLLTNPKTHIANMLGNTAMAGLETAKDLPAAIVDRILGVGTGVRSKSFSALGTAKATWKGAVAGIRDVKAVMQGVPTERDLMRWDLSREVTFKNPILRGYTQLIRRGLAAPDAFFRKVALHRALAEAERLQPGPVTEEMALQAVADAEYAVFQGGGKKAGEQSRLAQAGSGLRAPLGAAGHVIAPFTQTPGNVISATLDYSPFGAIRTGRDLYRLVKQARAGASEAELRALQKEASESAGRTITGTAPFLAGYILARDGKMTGARPEQKAERDQWDLEGKQENALHFGGKYYSLNRVSPIGNLMALGANYYGLQQEPGATALGAGAAALGSVGTTATEQSFLSGVQDLTDAIKQPKRAAGRYATNLAGSVVPAIVGAGARATDRTLRDIQTPADAVKSRIPGLSKTLPAKVNAMGQPKQRTGPAAGEFFDPTTARSESRDPVVRELARVGVNLSEPGQGRPNSATRAKWEKILPKAGPNQRAYVERQIARAKEGEQRPDYLTRETTEGQQLHQTLAALIALPRYRALPVEQRREFLERAIDTVRRRQARARKVNPLTGASR